MNEAIPILLIVYDATGDRAYWLHVQGYFRSRKWAARTGTAARATVHLSVENVLKEAAVRRFARLRDEARVRS